MAAQVETFDQAKQLIREFAAGGFTLKLALIDSTYVFDQTDTIWGDMSANEISGTGYTAGGKTCTGIAVADDGTIDMDDVAWAAATITFRRGILYISGTVDGKVNPVLFSYLYDDTPADKTVTASTFTHVVAAGGIV